jgi:hypothetical protein
MIANQSSEDVPYVVGCWTMTKAFVYFLISLPLIIYYTYSYSIIPSELEDETLVQVLKAYIIISWILVTPRITEMFTICQHWGETTTPKLWKSISLEHRRPLVYLKGLGLVCLCLGCYIMPKFYKLKSEQCDMFADFNSNICITYQMITFFTIFSLVTLAIPILILTVYVLGFCCLVCKDAGPSGFRDIYVQRYRESPVFRSLSDRVINQLPIVQVPPNDRTCGICLEEAHQGSQEDWMVLVCNHKFHPACVRPWLNEHNTCPLCRHVQPDQVAPPQNYQDQHRIEINIR